MCTLSDRDIRAALASGRLRIDPPIDEATQLDACSVDLRLGDTFWWLNAQTVRLIETWERIPDDAWHMTTITGSDGHKGALYLQPGQSVLATTIETMTLPDDIMARMDGRSSLARVNVIVHGTAGVFKPGWHGRPVLELSNLGRVAVALRPGMRICSFTFEQLTSPAARPYVGKYQGQNGVMAPKLWEDEQKR